MSKAGFEFLLNLLIDKGKADDAVELAKKELNRDLTEEEIIRVISNGDFFTMASFMKFSEYSEIAKLLSRKKRKEVLKNEIKACINKNYLGEASSIAKLLRSNKDITKKELIVLKDILIEKGSMQGLENLGYLEDLTEKEIKHILKVLPESDFRNRLSDKLCLAKMLPDGKEKTEILGKILEDCFGTHHFNVAFEISEILGKELTKSQIEDFVKARINHDGDIVEAGIIAKHLGESRTNYANCLNESELITVIDYWISEKSGGYILWALRNLPKGKKRDKAIKKVIKFAFSENNLSLAKTAAKLS